MALRTAGSVLVVFLWSVAVVLGKIGWSVTYTTQSIGTLKGSTVEMTCSYIYPRGHKVTSTIWFTKNLQVKVTTTWWSTTLTCSTTCTLTGNPTYIWYRNSKIVQEDSSPSYSVCFKTEDSFYCAVKAINSPAVSVAGHSYFQVTYTHQNICTLKGSSVDISCSYTYPSGHTVSETNWYTKGKLNEAPQILSLGYAGRMEYLGNMQSDSTLRITELREEDSAEYKFRFRTDQTNWEPTFTGTTLTVTGLQMKVTPAPVFPIRDTLFQCMTTSQAWPWRLLQHRQLTQTTRMMFTMPASTSLAPKTRKCLYTPPSSCLSPRFRTRMSSILL